MPTLEPTLAELVKQNPQETFRVIVRVDGDMEARASELEAEDFGITRRLRLIRGFGAMATGTTILRAMNLDWIVSIEPDSEVRTMSGEN